MRVLTETLLENEEHLLAHRLERALIKGHYPETVARLGTLANSAFVALFAKVRKVQLCFLVFRNKSYRHLAAPYGTSIRDESRSEIGVKPGAPSGEDVAANVLKVDGAEAEATNGKTAVHAD
jgi:hypothetical protein